MTAQCVSCFCALLQLPLLRGRDRSFTLLHALVEQILLHQPELATFPQELAEFEAVPDGERREKGVENNQQIKLNPSTSVQTHILTI